MHEVGNGMTDLAMQKKTHLVRRSFWVMEIDISPRSIIGCGGAGNTCFDVRSIGIKCWFLHFVAKSCHFLPKQKVVMLGKWSFSFPLKDVFEKKPPNLRA